MGLLSENDETQSLLKKQKLRWNQKLSKCPLIAILFGILLLVFIYILYILIDGRESKETPKTPERTFIVDYEQNEFLKDGQVFRYVSGSFHYFRVPKPYWKDRIKKMKAAGLNAVSTYVEWSLHEPYPGVYNFEDIADLEYFLKLVQDEGMYLLLRPGPFISAERDFGGFPFWLLNVVPKNSLRTNDPIYKHQIAKWFDVLMPKIVPFLYGNGGNIIMVQVENEYGTFYTCDHQYMIWLRDLYKSYIKSNAVLYTTDMCGDSFFKCGPVADVYATVDFGIWITDIKSCFNYMKENQKGGPLVNSEFYAGWASYWSTPLHVISSDKVVSAMKEMLALNASFNIFMFHGGTNFGFTSGAVKKIHQNYKPSVTSYDFSALLNEAGDPTEKYFKIKKLLEESNFAVSNDVSLVPAPKGNYGTFTMQPLVSIFEKVTQRIKPIESDVPLGFEIMGFKSGFVMYETTLTNDQKFVTAPVNLTISKIRDQATIFLDQVQVTIIPRKYENLPVSLNINSTVQKLSILIENQGRINLGNGIEDRKGIFEPVILGDHVLGPWKMIPYPLNETSWLSTIEPRKYAVLPAFYKTTFTLPDNLSEPLDTYLDPTGWKKGVAFVNGNNIGRYWPSVGPQITLYVPGLFLIPYPGVNTIIMLEQEGVPENLSISFVDKPNLNGTVNPIF
ncbi:beta-galactosidase-like isoform X2 [Myzus persicae]|uniref:beta-galactosidase-like isoform X2 n=1 Tax=Myzus persicae TaxID=13164 RepID=UPI000B9357CD|nr:beta-galactosidase-like isoform X2 [Myzus persicae]XP_022174725.1 beta-galactosidase-like isoform X2 [Myzus persicae]